MNRIIILTYPTLHRKTQDLCLQLTALGINNILLLSLPYTYKKTFNAKITHRPALTFPISLEQFALNLGMKHKSITHDHLYSELENLNASSILIGGAGILPPKVVQDFSIINAHPALLPLNRGLDALKWAIYNGTPVGVTTHIVNEKADAGWLIEQCPAEVFINDSFHALAQRLYELEIAMLVKASQKSWLKEKLPEIKLNENQLPNKRMPNTLESELFSLFKKYKNKFGKP